MTEQTTITAYTREGCHLCGDAIERIRDVVDSVSHEITLMLVDADSELRSEYGTRVPYVFIDDQPRFKYRVDEDELRSTLLNSER